MSFGNEETKVRSALTVEVDSLRAKLIAVEAELWEPGDDPAAAIRTLRAELEISEAYREEAQNETRGIRADLEAALDEVDRLSDRSLGHDSHVKAGVWLHGCEECGGLMEKEIRAANAKIAAARALIDDLQTRCDPAGDVTARHGAEQNAEGIAVLLKEAQAEEERLRGWISEWANGECDHDGCDCKDDSNPENCTCGCDVCDARRTLAEKGAGDKWSTGDVAARDAFLEDSKAIIERAEARLIADVGDILNKHLPTYDEPQPRSERVWSIGLLLAFGLLGASSANLFLPPSVVESPAILIVFVASAWAAAICALGLGVEALVRATPKKPNGSE